MTVASLLLVASAMMQSAVPGPPDVPLPPPPHTPPAFCTQITIVSPGEDAATRRFTADLHKVFAAYISSDRTACQQLELVVEEAALVPEIGPEDVAYSFTLALKRGNDPAKPHPTERFGGVCTLGRMCPMAIEDRVLMSPRLPTFEGSGPHYSRPPVIRPGKR